MCVNNLSKVATQWNSGATLDSNRGRLVLIPSALTTTPPSHMHYTWTQCWKSPLFTATIEANHFQNCPIAWHLQSIHLTLFYASPCIQSVQKAGGTWNWHEKSVQVSFYTASHKNVSHTLSLNYCPYLCQILTDFKNSFTSTSCGQFAIITLLQKYCKFSTGCASERIFKLGRYSIIGEAMDNRLVAGFYGSQRGSCSERDRWYVLLVDGWCRRNSTSASE